jgi:hypothetical protein
LRHEIYIIIGASILIIKHAPKTAIKRKNEELEEKKSFKFKISKNPVRSTRLNVILRTGFSPISFSLRTAFASIIIIIIVIIIDKQ